MAAGRVIGWVLPPVFLGLAAWFAIGPELEAIPRAPTPGVRPEQISTTPRRKVLGDPPVIHINGFDRTCMDCHKLIETDPKAPPRELQQHQHIRLHHGIHRNCWSCHDVADRDRLVLLDGTRIGYRDVVRLCGQCHGRIARDWEGGLHGRSNGYWDIRRGPRRLLVCTECHEPHDPRAPAFTPIPPLPGPHTLRMGEPVRPEEHHARPGHVDPLEKALRANTVGRETDR